MQPPPPLPDEPARLAALRGAGLLDTPSEPAFDDLIALTARLLNAPIAAFNLVDADRQWTKTGAGGLAHGDQVPRNVSFCAHTIASDAPLVVPDSRADPRFVGNPQIDDGVGFYVGAAVSALDGRRIGALCIAGDEPRTPSAADVETLRVLAAALSAHVQLQLREREREAETAALRQLSEITSRLARVTDAAQVRDDVCTAAVALAEADGAILWTAAPGDMLRAAAAVGSDITGVELPPGHGAASRKAFDRGRRIFRHGDQLVSYAGWGAALFEPLLVGDQAVGTLTVFWRERLTELPERREQLIALLGAEAAVALDRTTTLTELRKLSRVDALTGVGNRRAFDEHLLRELKRAERDGAPLALAMLDFDHFKAYNDAHGHPAGDRLLAQTATDWQNLLRATDSLARYGGEEFALLVPGCAVAEAVALVDRLRGVMSDERTCSAGVAVWDGDEPAESLLARADAALYAAKAAGRDRTMAAETPAAPTPGSAADGGTSVPR